MNREKSGGESAPVENPASNELHYVTVEAGEQTYGGWYRELPDGHIELFASATMQRQPRSDVAAREQAHAMLSAAVRAARADQGKLVSPQAGLAAGTNEVGMRKTLGDLLYTDSTKSQVSEDD